MAKISSLTHIKGVDLSTAALISEIKMAYSDPSAVLVMTPRVDKGEQPYAWIGIRIEDSQFDAKLPLNNDIMSFLIAFLQGRELPEVADFKIPEGVDNTEAWLETHYNEYAVEAKEEKKETSSTDGVFYLNKVLMFERGKITYPGKRYESILSMLRA